MVDVDPIKLQTIREMLDRYRFFLTYSWSDKEFDSSLSVDVMIDYLKQVEKDLIDSE